MTGLTEAGLVETKSVTNHEAPIQRNKQRNTTQNRTTEGLDSQIHEILGDLVKEKIEVMPWVIPKSSYFTQRFEENNMKCKAEKRVKIRDKKEMNRRIGRIQMVPKNMRTQVNMICLKKLQALRHKIVFKKKNIPKCIRIPGRNKSREKGKRDTRASKTNSYFSK